MDSDAQSTSYKSNIAIDRNAENPSVARVLKLLQPIATKRQEHFVCITLNAKHMVIGTHTVFIGSATASLVHPREVLARAIDDRAAAIIVGHNHPSGDPMPSNDDVSATRQLAAAAETMGIPLLDHVIVAGERYCSFKEQRLLVKPALVNEDIKKDIAKRFNELYTPLVHLIEALDVIEPGGTLAEDIRVREEDDNTVRLEFVARPTILTINDGVRKMVLRVVEL
ncbi:MAG TPA: JAB domain-containing protein [Candidatus Saccharimonadales bacterium]|nr:JAB domain-containing protein [Candidatus Saccharimonadales bacterium]